MDRRFSKFAPKFMFVLALSFIPLLTACASDSPETHLSWGVNDRLSPRRAPVRTAAAPANSGARTYVYQEPGGEASPPVPTPRPSYRVSATRQTPVYEYRDEPYRAPAASANASFAWPVAGDVISNFGVARNGERNDGINIATRMNAPIRASASGTVSYSDKLNGYGNLVLIKHANGYVTAYAHADRVLVAQGDFVAKGQVIGYAGQSGDVNSPQLHFEIRDGTKPVDPRRLLVARAGA
jgi:murein DD-endopeptidase MepM/ murein hydrolase activator NlpD